MRYGPGDYIVIPIGTTWRLNQDAGSDHRILYVESPSEIVPPKRYRNEWGQLLEHSPYSDRDIRVPDEVTTHDESGDFVVWVRARGRLTAYHFRHHPLDVVGWDGYLYPFIFNIGDFEPITGRVHQPPPVHQTFAGRNYVVCSFVPRKFDYHPLAIPAPYNHSNINSDEVIYYVAGNFMSRRGVEISSLHAASRRHPARAASGHGRGVDRQGGHRGAGGHDRHVPPAQHDQAGGGARGRLVRLLVAAARGRLRRGARTQRTRTGGLPRLMEPTMEPLDESPLEEPVEPITPMLDGSDVLQRLDDVEARLLAHARAEAPAGLTGAGRGRRRTLGGGPGLGAHRRVRALLAWPARDR